MIGGRRPGLGVVERRSGRQVSRRFASLEILLEIERAQTAGLSLGNAVELALLRFVPWAVERGSA